MGNWNEKKHERKRDRRARAREDNDGGRLVRLQELIREEVSYLLRGEVRDPRLQGVAVTMVQLAGDGSCARIWFTADTEDNDQTIAALDGAAGFLRSRLAESLGCKRTPELRFRRDPVTRALPRSEEGIV
jgi:ribosome-binding factor A